MMIQPINAKQILYVFDDQHALVDYTITQFIHIAEVAIGRQGACCIALSGGQTPKAFLHALTQSDRAKVLDWEKIHLFFSDERACSPDHPDSNYGMAMAFFKNEPFCKAHIYRMQAERMDREKAAAEYEQEILSVRSDAVFDLIFLGLGEDGHTASLFPNTAALSEKTKLVVPNFVEEKKTWRMTVTIPLINKAKHIIVLVVGSAKKQILQKIIHPNPIKNVSYPIELVGTSNCPALFFSDRHAAELCMSFGQNL